MVQATTNNLSYKDAVAQLNTLQSNAITIQKSRKKREARRGMNVSETFKFMKHLNLELEDIDRLNPIHVSGTKGKGSTCAFVECILRHLGFKTGFYSSPHLIHVRERIKVNGVSLTESAFADYFFTVYEMLLKNMLRDEMMPAYFKFLTLMAFYVFAQEKVDVAIIEVGIGGENDCTNVIANPVVCGVTTLDFDHTSLLGSTLEEIAWQKAGIFKPNSVAVVADQTEKTMEVMKSRAIERNCTLHVAPPLQAYSWPSKPFKVGIAGKHQYWNISLALQLSRLWLEKTGKSALFNKNEKVLKNCNQNFSTLDGFVVPNDFINGLSSCHWPGRSQIIRRGGVTYYFDGAHTPKSLQCCKQWYLMERERSQKEKAYRILLFHCTADRDPETLLPYLKECSFDAAIFSPTRVYPIMNDHSDLANFNQSGMEELLKVKRNASVWKSLVPETALTEDFTCILSAFERIRSLKQIHGGSVEVLVTGSLHLIGGFLSLLESQS